ncbi:MAG: hypothetical protein NTV80_22265 [Verrucomicrobia bacterium]|nr:hypothetical protein [Verrucomicrobiota bacterium]
MNPPRDQSKTPVQNPARWISPWSYDDEWEREHAKAKTRAEQPPLEADQAPKSDAESAPQLGKSSVFAQASTAVPQPTADSRSKSFEEFGSFAEIQEPEILPTPNKISAADLSRFRPPELQPTSTPPPSPAPKIPTPAEPSQPKISGPVAPAQVKPAPQFKAEPVEPSLPALTPQRRPAAVPTSTMPRPETSSSWGGAIILCLGMLGLVMLAWIYLTDVKLGSDEDLRIQTPVDQTPKIAAPERMLTFLNAVMKIENMDLALQPAWDWDPVLLDQFVKANSSNNAFDNLLDLLEDFDWHPHHAAWHAEDLGDHPSWPHVRILLQARTIFLLRHGDESAAFAAAIDIAEMSRRMQELWAWPTFMQRSQEMHMAAVQTMAELLRKTLLNSATLGKYQDEFLRCEPSDAILQDAFRGFYIHEKSLMFGEKTGIPLDTLPRGITQERPARLFFKKNETLSLFADVFRHLRDEIVKPPFASFGTASQIVSYPKLSRSFSFQPNGAGEAYFAERIQPYIDMPSRHAMAKTRHNLVLCLFATRRFIADQQRLPAGLSELKPSYLMEVPRDDFSGLPLCYDALNGLIFSVGNNFKDDDGKVTQPPLLDPAEPTVEIGIKVAAPAPSTSK